MSPSAVHLFLDAPSTVQLLDPPSRERLYGTEVDRIGLPRSSALHLDNQLGVEVVLGDGDRACLARAGSLVAQPDGTLAGAHEAPDGTPIDVICRPLTPRTGSAR